MSFLDEIAGFFGGGDDEVQTTTETKLPAWLEKYQRAIAEGAGKNIAPYLDNPTPFVAGLTDTQQKVGSSANSLLDYNLGLMGLGNTADYTSQFMDIRGNLNPFVGYTDPGLYDSAIDSSTIDIDDIRGLANPYAQDIMDARERQRGRAYESAQRDIGAEAAAGGAFGGSGEAIRRSLLDENLMQAAEDDAAQTMFDSYGIGAQLAGNNAAARTGALQTAGAANMQMFNDQFSRAQNANSFNLQALGSGANYAQGRTTMNNSLANDSTSRVLQSAGLLGGYGDLQRSYAQQVGDQPYTQFQRFAGFIPGVQGQQVTTSPSTAPGLGQTALGALLTVGSAPTAGGGSLFGNWLG